MSTALFSIAFLSRIMFIALCLLLCACSQTSNKQYSLDKLPDFVTDEERLSPRQAVERTPSIEPLVLNDEMKRFVDFHVDQEQSLRQRVQSLYFALRSPGFLGLEYDPEKTFTAQDAFKNGKANCVGFSNLYIAMARYAGIDAKYQLVRENPSWNKRGNVVRLNVHVNVIIPLPGNFHYTVDIDPRPVQRWDNQSAIADNTATALHYNNLAINALTKADLKQAYSLLIRAIDLAPNQELLWTNFGTVLRNNKQWSHAETSYRIALQINPISSTALNNLSALYAARGDYEKSEFYAKKVQRYRNKNPYYHYQLSQQAQKNGNTKQAIVHLKNAIKRNKSEAEFYYTLSKIYFSSKQFKESLLWINKALEQSTLESQRKIYREHQQKIYQLLGKKSYIFKQKKGASTGTLSKI